MVQSKILQSVSILEILFNKLNYREIYTLMEDSDVKNAVKTSPFLQHLVMVKKYETISSIQSQSTYHAIFAEYNEHLIMIYNGTYVRYDMVSEKHRPLFGQGKQIILCAVFSPDGRTLFIGSIDNKIRRWNLLTENLDDSLIGHGDWVRCLAISPCGQILISGSDDKTIRRWNLVTGKQICEPILKSDWTTCLAISPNGQMLVSGETSGSIIRYDLLTGNPIDPPMIGHGDWVRCLAITPNGQILVSGSDDNTIRRWNLFGIQIGQTLIGHTDMIRDLRISSDSHTLLSVSRDKKIKIWDLRK